MGLETWLEPPRRFIVLFMLVTLVPSLALVASGWRLLEQERALSLNQLTERREQAADRAVADLERLVSGAERELDDPQALVASAAGHDDVVGVTFTGRHVDVFPVGRLAFYPLGDAGVEAPAERFAPAERLEFQQQALPSAIQAYRELARSTEPAIRAGAMIRLARALRKHGQTGEALDAYADVARLSGVAVAGVPADLLARWAECALLDALERRADLLDRARALHADLTEGRWRLERATYELHLHEVTRWLAGAAPVAHPDERVALATAVETLWQTWRSGASDRLTGAGRRVIDVSGRRITVLWRSAADRLTAFVAGPAFVQRQWLTPIEAPLERQRMRLAFNAAPGDDGTEARRSSAVTGLPWDLSVHDVDLDAEMTRVAARRTLWLWGLALLLVVTAGGVVIGARTVLRDAAVARLQSDFVSAVSHEFRTPVTTLRQLTEVLLDGRVPTEDRRDTYYRALMRQTDRLQRLVESLLDFGRMEAGTTPYRLEPLDAAALVRTVVNDFQQDVAHEYRFDLLLPDAARPAITIVGDREALTHAVWNLLDNAVKYSPGCRTVRVAVERDGSDVAIRVQDSGLGIPRHERNDIFRRFVRGSEAKALGIKGTGIGLAMVRHIVGAHSGHVLLTTAPGAGSTFTILLPCHAS